MNCPRGAGIGQLTATVRTGPIPEGVGHPEAIHGRASGEHTQRSRHSRRVVAMALDRWEGRMSICCWKRDISSPSNVLAAVSHTQGIQGTHVGVESLASHNRGGPPDKTAARCFSSPWRSPYNKRTMEAGVWDIWAFRPNAKSISYVLSM